ncbi:MAG: hybrid sensor histidine kinase/response regulator, partial [Pirellulaceae bacterium]
MSAKILVVDRSDEIRHYLQSSLELDGYDVLQATDGLNGYAQIVAELPDVVLLDQTLPDMDGVELLLKTKEHDRTRATAVIMISESGRDDKVVAALELGATDFVPKPFSASVVRARVRNALRVRNLQSRIRAEREHAELANANKSAFLARMSHEIRTPMTAILGFADILYLEGDIERAPAHRIEAIRTIKRNAEYLLDLINDILDLSKAEAGRLDVERYRCSATQVAAEVISLLSVRADKKGFPLVFTIDGPVPETVHTDPTRLRQILINLVSNAIKFTDHGRVEVAVKLLESGSDDPHLLFEVRDTGIGLTPEQRDRIFQPFMQATPYTRRDYGGTGLGLVISKQLAEMLGGTISVTSVPGQGATFRLTIAVGSLEGVRLLHSVDPV